MPMSINRYSKTAVAIIQRAAADPSYRSLLLHDPDAALAGQDLSATERAALSSLTAESLNAPIAELRG